MNEQFDYLSAIKDIASVFYNVRDALDRISYWIYDNRDQIAAVARVAKNYSVFKEAGWFFHHTTPFDLILENTTAQGLTAVLNTYYLGNWPDIANRFRARVEAMPIDTEARAAFDEALSAHGAGLYRASVRVLFPEIERLARVLLLDGRLKGIASLKEVRQAAGGLPFGVFVQSPSGLIFHQFEIMYDHLYENIDTPESVAKFKASPIPNRHAAIHGLIVYNNLQSSLAALMMAEFMFEVITIIKARLNGTDPTPDEPTP